VHPVSPGRQTGAFILLPEPAWVAATACIPTSWATAGSPILREGSNVALFSFGEALREFATTACLLELPDDDLPITEQARFVTAGMLRLQQENSAIARK
jgi:hypothetical protein